MSSVKIKFICKINKKYVFNLEKNKKEYF